MSAVRSTSTNKAEYILINLTGALQRHGRLQTAPTLAPSSKLQAN